MSDHDKIVSALSRIHERDPDLALVLDHLYTFSCKADQLADSAASMLESVQPMLENLGSSPIMKMFG